MSYVSPISLVFDAEDPKLELIAQAEKIVVKACSRVGCEVDKDELEKALAYDRGQYERGYADGMRDALPRWTSMREGIPKESGEYLVAFDGGYVACIWWDNEALAFRGSPITHWMPKPAPPKEDT